MLTTREVAVLFGVTTTTVRRWCDYGRLPGAQKVGDGYRATWVIPEDALAEFVPPRPGRPQKRARDV